MLIVDQDEMEKIISSRKDLEWDGWNVVKYTNSNSAMYSVDGAFRHGKWVKKKVFPLTEDGWHLPNSLGGNNAQVEK